MRRLTAIFALVVAAATLALAIAVAINQFPRGLALLGCVLIASASAWYGLRRRGVARVVGVIVAGIALVGAVALIVVGGARFVDLLIVAGLLVSLAAASAAFTIHVDLPSATVPRQPVLFFNPRSGGGKAERFQLAKEARERGIEPIELKPGDDLEVLVRGAVERGADGLAMAGGDGSQAIVAKVAAERGLPYACVPAGTRNHFALDLGVDREDVVGALDAFVDGGERRVDLAEVNGRVFVDNVALGLYAEAVQRAGYRDAKIRTVLDTVPDVVGPGGSEIDLRWTGPGGHEHHAGAVVLVSNNQYRLGRPTRPRRHRRRSARPRCAAPLSHSAGSLMGAHRPQAPGRLALGYNSRRYVGQHCRVGADRLRPPPETRKLNIGEARMNNKMEITEKERLSREDAAARLHALADELARHNEVEFDRGGVTFKVHVPDEVDFKLEIEFEDDERELEVELKW
jgi:amphi-Trp domain-containing protein